MKNSMSKHAEAFDNGVAYEVARECINSEIARHQAALYAIGNDEDPKAKRHLEAVHSLLEVQRRLNPDDPQMIEIVRLLVRGFWRDTDTEEARKDA